METNYKLCIEEKYDESHDKFIEIFKRNNKMGNAKDDDLDAEIFEDKVHANNLKSDVGFVMKTNVKGGYLHPDQDIKVKGKIKRC